MTALLLALAATTAILAMLGWRDEPGLARLWRQVLSPKGRRLYDLVDRQIAALEKAIHFNDSSPQPSVEIGDEMKKERASLLRAHGLWKRMMWVAQRE